LGSVTTVDINGGTIDGVTIGGASAGAITGTTITGSGDMAIDTDTLFVDASENRVGVGTASPDRTLHIVGPDGDGEGTPATNSNCVAIFQNNGFSTDGCIVNIIAGSENAGSIAFGDADDDIRQRIVASMSDDSLAFNTGNNSEAMRIVSDGEVLVGGTTTDLAITSIATDAGLSVQASGSANLKLFRNDTSISSGNVIGGVSWYGSDTTGNNPTGLAYIVAEASGTHAAGDNPTDLVFGVTADGSETVAEAMRIDSSGNVGIGTESPSAELHIEDSASSCTLRIISEASSDARILMGDDGYGARGRIVYDNSDDSLQFWGANSTTSAERMRIDSSGNLLVSGTVVGAGVGDTNTGITLGAGHFISASRENLTPLFLNRNTSDGNIIDLRKDGTTVGSIASRSGVTVFFVGDPRTSGEGGASLHPIGGDTPSVRAGDHSGIVDDYMDLGADNSRFKDLYLSGGVYVGGTVAANKFDDYEEGTWTPTIGTGSIGSVNDATYTKIGNSVTVRVSLGNISDTTTATAIEITGLPYAPDGDNRATGACMARNLSPTADQVIVYVGTTNFLYFFKIFFDGSAWDQLQHSDLNGGADFIFSITYFTSS